MPSIRVKTVHCADVLSQEVQSNFTVSDLKAGLEKQGIPVQNDTAFVSGRFHKDSEALDTSNNDIVFMLPSDSLNIGSEKYDNAAVEMLRREAGLAANWESHGQMYEYTSAANPNISPVPWLVFPSKHHEEGPTRVIPFDLSKQLQVSYTATSPNLLASYIRIANAGEKVESEAVATSQAFYVIRGSGKSQTEYGEVVWKEGDLFTLPACQKNVVHESTSAVPVALYWVHDQPLLEYLGVKPCKKKFEPTLYKNEEMIKTVERIRHEPGAEHKNRIGFLFGNTATADSTKTLTHTLWALYNLLPKGDSQRPHKHNSVALDLAVACKPGCYTLMGWELDENGWVKDPIRVDWAPGTCFVTPPGMWHSHHNESDGDAYVLPLQDAGLVTYQRVLQISFSTKEMYPNSPNAPSELGKSNPKSNNVYEA